MRHLLPLALFTIVLLQGNSAWSAESQSQTYHVSVTIPEHVVTASAGQNNRPQPVQTQNMVRNNQTVAVRSIVVP